MKSPQWKLGIAASATLILLVTIFAAVTPAGSAQDSTPRILFGMDINSMDAQKQAGVPADYATLWVGVWNLKSGWAGTNAAVDRAVANGVTPVVHFYYWGDDISKNCVENGCYSTLHGAQKDKAGWQRLAEELATNLNAHRNGKPVVIIIESEFNKADIQTYEAFDGYLLEKEQFFREKIPGVQLVLGFGTWNMDAWKTFDRAAAAADFIGIQALRGSTRDTLTRYEGVVDATLAGMKRANTFFGKPIILTDLGLSSYPDAEYENHQARVLGAFFSRIEELKANGLRGIIYRSWSDTPSMSTANWYGEGERHWGLVRTTEPSAKAAKSVWVEGVKAARNDFQATFTVSPHVNEWWVEVVVKGNQTVNRVDATINGGAWKPLTLQNWGHWGKSFNIPRGSQVQFRATSANGATDVSDITTWMAASSPSPTTSSPPPTSITQTPAPTTTSSAPAPSASTFDANFHPKAVGNQWWVEADVWSTEHTIQSVEAQVNGGSWRMLDKQSSGSWAKSFNVPNGSQVTFRATSSTGATDVSAPTTWTRPATTSPTPTPTTAAPRPSNAHIEAESFSTKPSGHQMDDASTSGGAYWNQTLNGAIEHVIDTQSGQYELRVRAKGERLSGIAPQMNVYVDGVLLGGKRPDTEWADHAFPISLGAGSHSVKIAFTNDYNNGSGDRNLHVDNVDLVYVGP